MKIDLKSCQRKSLGLEAISTLDDGVLVARDRDSVLMKSLVNPVVDVGDMTATAVINTDAIDRDGEVILASGVSLLNYQNNPVVLWDHGLVGVTLPIGKAESPDGELAVVRSDTSIESTTYFSQRFDFAAQVFGLIDEGVIRATSIRVTPESMAVYRLPDGQEVIVTEESDMVEYSWAPLGVNPEALRQMKSLRIGDGVVEAVELQLDRAASVLNRGTLGGSRLMPEIRKSLAAMAKPKGQLVNSIGRLKEAADMKLRTLTAPELRKLGLEQLKSLDLELYDSGTLERAAERVKALELDEGEGVDLSEGVGGDGDGVDDSDDAEDVVADEGGGDGRLGAKVLTDAFQAVDYLVKYLESALKPVEEERVVAGMGGELKSLVESKDAIRGLFATVYPDLPALGVDDAKSEASAGEDQLKSLLASNQRSRFRMAGLGAMVEALAKAPNLTRAQRKSLREVTGKFDGFLSEAASFKPEIPDGYIPKDQYEALVGRVDKLTAALEAKLLPASEPE